MEDRVIIYTDGSAIDNGTSDSRTGWAVKLMYKGQAKLHSGVGKRGYTNNQMEMYAVYKAMDYMTNKDVPVTIYSDSQYVVKTFNGEYNGSANEAMWKQLRAERAKFKDIKFEWVKGHSNDPHNIEVDQKAFEEANNATV